MKVRTYPALYLPATRPSAALLARYYKQRQRWWDGPKNAKLARFAHCQQLRSAFELL